MKTIIHDIKKVPLSIFDDGDRIVCSESNISYCRGCFGCWFKNPTKCVIKDDIFDISGSLLKSDELVIISRCIGGSYSGFVKKALERCIGYVYPFFEMRQSEIHHKLRSKNKIKLRVYFYGEITDIEKNIAISFVNANRKNIDSSSTDICFIDNIDKENIHDIIYK